MEARDFYMACGFNLRINEWKACLAVGRLMYLPFVSMRPKRIVFVIFAPVNRIFCVVIVCRNQANQVSQAISKAFTIAKRILNNKNNREAISSKTSIRYSTNPLMCIIIKCFLIQRDQTPIKACKACKAFFTVQSDVVAGQTRNTSWLFTYIDSIAVHPISTLLFSHCTENV